MLERNAQQQKQSKARETASPAPVLRTQDVFRGGREIWIEHEGKYYRLRITRRNKLILQK